MILFKRVSKLYYHCVQMLLRANQRPVVCWHFTLPRVQLEAFPRSCGWALLLHLCLCTGKARPRPWSLSLMARFVPMACLIATPSGSQLGIGICCLKLPRYSGTLLQLTGSSPSLCTVLSPPSVAVLEKPSTCLIHSKNMYNSSLILASQPQLSTKLLNFLSTVGEFYYGRVLS